MRMRDKVAVLTGGASGIGKRTAERFVEEGGRVVIADVQDNLGERVTDRLGDRARFVHCDGNRPGIWGIVTIGIRPVGYVAGWAFTDGMDAAFSWDGD